MNSQMFATATIARMVGAKYDMRTSARPGSARLTSSAMPIASAIDSGIVPSANQPLFASAVQKIGSSIIAA